jgi:hypothetical protein
VALKNKATMFKLEFSYQREVIESREFDYAPIIPREGEKIRLEFTNETYNSDGFWWQVVEVHHLFSPANMVPKPNMPELNHIVTIYIEKDPNQGLPKNDPLHKS